MSKKLMNEQLPTPVVAATDGPRDRVMRHMRDALAAGASFALAAGCSPFGVVDPLPPPAKCRALKADKLVTATATTVTPTPLLIRVELAAEFESGLQGNFRPWAVVRRGTLVAEDAGVGYLVAPTDGGTSFDLVVRAKCEDYRQGNFDIGVQVTVDYSGPGTPTAVVMQVDPPDGGP